MKKIYDPTTLQEFIQRIDTLKQDTQRKWGKMDVAQMLAHCNAALAEPLGEVSLKTPLLARIAGPLFRSAITNEKPFSKNSPTAGAFIMKDTRDFEVERARLKDKIKRISHAGAAALEGRRHHFFGKFSAQDWSNSIVKHIDHHLRQFGV